MHLFLLAVSLSSARHPRMFYVAKCFFKTLLRVANNIMRSSNDGSLHMFTLEAFTTKLNKYPHEDSARVRTYILCVPYHLEYDCYE